MANAKREKNFTRSYSDSSNAVEVSHEDEVIAQVDMSKVSPEVLKRAAMRYLADTVVGVGNAAMKAEGGTLESAIAKMGETVKSLEEGTFKFRAASGQGSLSTEEEQSIMAETIVSLGKAPDKETALAKVQALYAKTKPNAKGNITRPDYNALRNVPQIKAALADASKAESNLDTLLA